MSDNTKIQWSDASWNPLRARSGGKVGWSCVKISEGCAHCYAGDRVNKRWGTGLDYTVTDNARVEHFLDERTLAKPLHWRKPRRVFVCSMTDLFGEWVPDEWIAAVFAIMALASEHDFQVLTKRPERMHAWMQKITRGDLQPKRTRAARACALALAQVLGSAAVRIDGFEALARVGVTWPLPNVWLGVSAEDQQRADERIPVLLDTPAAVRFISAEPLLGPLTLCICGGWPGDLEGPRRECPVHGDPGLDWVIVGGESGPHARPFDLAWARSLMAQCRGASVPFFFKQGGASNRCPHSAHGSHLDCLPPDLQVREFPR